MLAQDWAQVLLLLLMATCWALVLVILVPAWESVLLKLLMPLAMAEDWELVLVVSKEWELDLEMLVPLLQLLLAQDWALVLVLSVLLLLLPLAHDWAILPLRQIKLLGILQVSPRLLVLLQLFPIGNLPHPFQHTPYTSGRGSSA